MEARCKCGKRRYANEAEAHKAEPDGSHKCPNCRTFARDHAWMPGWDPEENRCGQCDTRYGSHGG